MDIQSSSTSIEMQSSGVNNPLQETSWLRRWRELLAYTFMAILIYDFILAPTFHPLVSYYFHFPYLPWVPLTLGAGGTFFIAMGAILGASAYGKSQENAEMIRNLPDYSSFPGQYGMGAGMTNGGMGMGYQPGGYQQSYPQYQQPQPMMQPTIPTIDTAPPPGPVQHHHSDLSPNA
jgi:hypothetical protein